MFYNLLTEDWQKASFTLLAKEAYMFYNLLTEDWQKASFTLLAKEFCQ